MQPFESCLGVERKSTEKKMSIVDCQSQRSAKIPEEHSGICCISVRVLEITSRRNILRLQAKLS